MNSNGKEKNMKSLGELMGEHDGKMLRVAFVETEDYRTILEEEKPWIIVGRRGTGKSAMAEELKKEAAGSNEQVSIVTRPEEDTWIRLRETMPKWFGDEDRSVRNGTEVIWHYALVMEAACKVQDIAGKPRDKWLREKLSKWGKRGRNIT